MGQVEHGRAQIPRESETLENILSMLNFGIQSQRQPCRLKHSCEVCSKHGCDIKILYVNIKFSGYLHSGEDRLKTNHHQLKCSTLQSDIIRLQAILDFHIAIFVSAPILK